MMNERDPFNIDLVIVNYYLLLIVIANVTQTVKSLQTETSRVQHRALKLQAHQQRLKLSKAAQEDLYAEVCHTLNMRELEVSMHFCGDI